MDNLMTFDEFINESNNEIKDIDELIKVIQDALVENWHVLKPRVEVFKTGILQVMFNRPVRPEAMRNIMADIQKAIPTYYVNYGRGATEGNIVIHHDLK